MGALQVVRVAKVDFPPLSQREGARWTILDCVNVLHYVLMGLMVLPDIATIVEVLPARATYGIAAGGSLYLIGVPFLLTEQLEFHQPCWHMLVLVASICFYTVIISDFVG